MTNPVRDRLTEVLREAHYRIVGSSSDCRVDPGAVLADAILSSGLGVVELPELKADDRGLYEVEDTDLRVRFTDDEFQLWVWNSVRGCNLQKTYSDRSVGTDLAALILAAAAEARS